MSHPKNAFESSRGLSAPVAISAPARIRLPEEVSNSDDYASGCSSQSRRMGSPAQQLAAMSRVSITQKIHTEFCSYMGIGVENERARWPVGAAE